MSEFSDRLKDLRKNRSQSQFSQILGVSQQKYSRWETGRFEPSISEIRTICKTLGVSADWLLGLSDERSGGASVTVTATGGSAVASQSPGARVAASATSVEVERLRGEVAALERALRMFAGRGREV